MDNQEVDFTFRCTVYKTQGMIQNGKIPIRSKFSSYNKVIEKLIFSSGAEA